MKYMSQGSWVAEPGLWTQDTHHPYCRHREAKMKPLRWRISQVIKWAVHHAFQHSLTQLSTQMIVTTCSRHARLLLTAWPWESHWTSLGLRYFHLQNEGVKLKKKGGVSLSMADRSDWLSHSFPLYLQLGLRILLNPAHWVFTTHL